MKSNGLLICVVCAFFATTGTVTSAMPQGGIAAGEIDIRSSGAKGDGRTIDGPAIEAAMAKNPRGKFYFPPGTYLLDNSKRVGLHGVYFSGGLHFAPGARLVCTTVSPKVPDCVALSRGTGAVIDGMEIAFAQPTPQDRNSAAGFALHCMFQNNLRASNIRIDGSSGAGLSDENGMDDVFTHIVIKNTSADGFTSVNSKNTHLSDLTVDVALDDGLSMINYENHPDNRGFIGNNIKVSHGAARGIAVLGQSDVQITNFSVNQTCSAGVQVFDDFPFKTRRPDNVTFSNGEISGAGRYTNEHYPCKNAEANGSGMHYIAADDVHFDHVKITDSAGPAIAGNMGPTGPDSKSVSISNMEIIGAPTGADRPKVGGVMIFKTNHLELSKISVTNASGGFFVSRNGDVKASDLSAKNVKGFLHRSYDFEGNDKVTGERLVTSDDQETPTGEGFYEDNKSPSTFKSVEAHIAKGQLQVHKSATTTMEVVSKH
jgi:hypothetical protein